MSQPQSVLITLAAGTPQQGPDVPLALGRKVTLITGSGNNAAGVTIGNSAANSAVGTGGVMEPSETVAFSGLANFNQLWFTGTAADKISGFGI